MPAVITEAVRDTRHYGFAFVMMHRETSMSELMQVSLTMRSFVFFFTLVFSALSAYLAYESMAVYSDTNGVNIGA